MICIPTTLLHAAYSAYPVIIRFQTIPKNCDFHTFPSCGSASLESFVRKALDLLEEAWSATCPPNRIMYLGILWSLQEGQIWSYITSTWSINYVSKEPRMWAILLAYVIILVLCIFCSFGRFCTGRQSPIWNVERWLGGRKSCSFWVPFFLFTWLKRYNSALRSCASGHAWEAYRSLADG